MQIKPCTQCFLSYIIISPFLSFALRIQAACISAAVTDNASQKRQTSSGSLSFSAHQEIVLFLNVFWRREAEPVSRSSLCNSCCQFRLQQKWTEIVCEQVKLLSIQSFANPTVKVKARGVAESRITDIWSSQEAVCAYKEHQWEAVSTRRASKNEKQRVGGSTAAAAVVCPAQFWIEIEKPT